MDLLPDFASMHFKSPELLWGLLLVPALWLYHFKVKVPRRPHMTISSTQSFAQRKPGLRVRLAELPVWLRGITMAFL
ncbi:MAG: BatA domain-containing protein, partial [Bacteroidota bacterium]